MADPTPTHVLLTTTFRPLVMELSGSLAHGARLVADFLEQAPSPEKTATFERDLRALLREVGRRIMAWVLNHLEPERDEEAPSVLRFEDRLYRRRPRSRRSIATLFGVVAVWRRLYEPLGGGGRSLHPLEMRLGIEAGLATPALAERVGRGSTEQTQRQVLNQLEEDHGVSWSCTSLRKLLWALRAGMAPHRHGAQVAQVVTWLEQARASQGRFRPTLSVGRDGIFVPLRHGVWQEGATATVSVLDRSAKRLGTVYLGHMPESGQGTLTTQLNALLRDILTQIDSQSLRLVYVSDEGYHPSGYYHRVLKTMADPRRPWRPLTWRRIVDFYHACHYVQQLAEAIFGAGSAAQAWAKQMRHVLKTQVGGVSRVLKSASGLRRGRGLHGTAKAYNQAYGYLKKRSPWMQYQAYRLQKLPIGSGITEAACKVVFTQRFKRSGMSWTIEGGQVILDLRVIWLSGVWDEVHRHSLASKPMPSLQTETGRDKQREPKAA
jgi:hypothetical protein